MGNYIDLRDLINSSIANQVQGLNMLKKALLQIVDTAENNEKEILKKMKVIAAPQQGDIYTVDEMCKLFNIKRATLYKWVASGKIPHSKPAGGKLLFYKHQITEFFNKKNGISRF